MMGDDITEDELRMIMAVENQWTAVVALLALGEHLRDGAKEEM